MTLMDGLLHGPWWAKALLGVGILAWGAGVFCMGYRAGKGCSDKESAA